MQSTTSSTRTFITPTPNADDSEPKKRLSLRRRFTKKSLPWLLIVGLVAVSLFLLLQYRTAQAKLQSTGAASAQQVDTLIAKVSKLVIVPQNEKPTVATVLHADKLRSQSFFVNAQDGDKVLVYSKEKEAILYRPKTNQIVTIAPVSVTPTAGSNLSN